MKEENYYLINDSIEFYIDANKLVDKKTGASVEMNLISSRLLYFLLQNAGGVSTRNEILTEVFDSNGVSATDGNLNQHVMLLRRAFNELNCQDEIIITVPKVGFRMAAIKLQKSNEENAQDKLDGFEKKHFSYICLAGASLFFLAAGLYYFTTHGKDLRPQVSIVKKEVKNQCEFLYTAGANYQAPDDIVSSLNEKKVILDCNSPQKIYIWRSSTTEQRWDFTAICDVNNKCRGNYVYAQK